MRRVFTVIVLALAGFALDAPARAETLTLADALALAYSTNPELEAQRAKVRSADSAVAEARGNWRPSVNLSGSYGYEHAGDFSVGLVQNFAPIDARASVSQPVFTGGQANAQVQRAIALVRAARADLFNAEQQILLAAATAYMDVVRDVQALGLRQSDVDVLVRQQDATKTQLAAGDATKTDLQQVEVRIAAAQADLVLARAQLAQSRDNFERVIGRQAETLVAAPALPWVPDTQEQALSIALRLSPRIQSAKANDMAAQYGIDNAVGALLPHASIVTQYEYQEHSLFSPFGLRFPTGTVSVLGQVSVPIYQGGGEEARIREAKEQRSQTRLGIADADQATRQSVKDTWAGFHSAQAAVGFDQSRVTSSEAALDGVIQQQRQGERSVLDILNAEQERLAAEIALSSARHDMVVSSYQLLAVTGRLTAKDQGLKVKLYDPQVHYDDAAGSWLGFGD